jgi:hypothetical protein
LLNASGGDYLAGPPGHRAPVERVAEVYFFELHDGRITRAWGLEDNLSRMRQLGHIE